MSLDWFWGILPVLAFVFFTILYLWKKYKINYFKYMFFALYPYMFANPIHTQVYMRMVIGLLIIAAVCFGYDILMKKFAVSKIFLAYMIFLIYLIISGAVICPDANYFIGIRNMIVFSMSSFALYYHEGENIDNFAAVARTNMIIMSVCGILQAVIGYSFRLQYLYSNSYRISAFTMNSNTYAHMILFYLFFATERKLARKDFKYYFLAAVSIALSGSVSATLGLLIFLIDFGKLKRFTKCISKIFMAGALVFMTSLVVIRWRYPVRFNTLFASQSDRMSLWALFLNAFIKRPLFGHGWNTLGARMELFIKNLPDNSFSDYLYRIISDGYTVVAHNDFIRLLAETGITGLILCMVFIWFSFDKTYRSGCTKYIKFLMSGVVFFLTHNTLQEYTFWLTFFAPLLLYERRMPAVRCRNYISIEKRKELIGHA